MGESCDLGAVEALDLISKKKLSPVELLGSCIERIDTINDTVNAVVAMDREAALAHAKIVEKKIARDEDTGLLGGLPTGIKDLEATAGLRTTWGSLIYKDHVPDADDDMVASIRANGGNIFCKTNTPEFGAGANTVNRVYGATGNPFNPEKTCAGSSGGTAVALATGMMPVATGSDYGGSLRTPASFCGITGFRPSPGVVPSTSGGVALSPFPVLGPMGRNVADTHLLLRAQICNDRRDPFNGVADPIPDVLDNVELSSIKAAWTSDFGCCPVERAIREIFAARCGEFGSEFGEFFERSPKMDAVHDTFEVLRGVNFVAGHAERLQNHRDLLGPNVIDNTERGLQLTATDVARASLQQTDLYKEMLSLFDDADVLISPAAAVSPFPHTQLSVTEINGEPMPTYMRWLALAYVPTTTLCCALVVPCGLDKQGMPFGLQIVGPNGSDAKVLAVGAALEQVLQANPNSERPKPDLRRLE